MLKWMVMALAMVLAGCATTQVQPGVATTVPADRVLVSARTGEAEIVVVRDAGFLGGGCFHALTVNRQLVARIDTGETLRLRVPAGELLLTVGADPEGRALCGLQRDYRVQREFSIRPGEVKHYRLVVGPGGLDVMRSDF